MEDNFYRENEAAGRNLWDTGIRRPTIAQISILYSISIILLFLVGTRVQRNEFYSGVLITEFVLILLPPLILLLVYRYDLRSILRLHRIKLSNIFLIFGIMLFAIPTVSVFNLANYWLIKYIFGKVDIAQPPAASTPGGLLISLLVIAGSAGICEEVMFRGVMQRGLERLGTVKSILLTAFFFGLMHMDFQKLLGTFLLGALIGFIVYRTDSVFGGMFAHFSNNATAVLITYGAGKLSEMAKASGLEGINRQSADTALSSASSLSQGQMLGAIIVGSFFIAICVTAFIGLLLAFVKNTSGKAVLVSGDKVRNEKGSMLWLLPGALTIGFIYTAEGLKLLGLNVQVIENILRFLGVR